MDPEVRRLGPRSIAVRALGVIVLLLMVWASLLVVLGAMVASSCEPYPDLENYLSLVADEVGSSMNSPLYTLAAAVVAIFLLGLGRAFDARLEAPVRSSLRVNFAAAPLWFSWALFSPVFCTTWSGFDLLERPEWLGNPAIEIAKWGLLPVAFIVFVRCSVSMGSDRIDEGRSRRRIVEFGADS